MIFLEIFSMEHSEVHQQMFGYPASPREKERNEKCSHHTRSNASADKHFDTLPIHIGLK